jgi:hypothetical protein
MRTSCKWSQERISEWEGAGFKDLFVLSKHNTEDMTGRWFYFRFAPLFILILLVAGNAAAQISEGGYPPSYSRSDLKSAAKLPVFTLDKLDREALLREEEEIAFPNRYGIFKDVEIDILKQGEVREIHEQNGRIWNYRIQGENCYSIQLYFTKFLLPPGAKLFIYNADYSMIYGAYTSGNNNDWNKLMIADFPGNELIVEYFEPNDALFEGELTVGSIGQSYQDPFSGSSSEDEEGYINVNCREGEDWQEQKHSVCYISFKVGNGQATCTGAFINNARNDGTPFFLTANHCLSTQESAITVNAFFNFEALGCDGPLNSSYPGSYVSGAQLMTTGEASDYTLLKFANNLQPGFQTYFAGWDVSGDSSQYSTCIHHPEGTSKKISLDMEPSISFPAEISWNDNTTSPPDTHWWVVFDKGRTNSGSSGAPLFNEDKQIIGQLHGGDPINKFYGRLDYSWNNADPGQSTTLKDHLDPDNTGITSIGGYYENDLLPDPQFYPEFYDICADAPVKLTAFSAFEPTAWNWQFVPNDIIFSQGTDASSKEPVVSFPTETNYRVSLEATNSVGSKNHVFPGAMKASDGINVAIEFSVIEDSCVCTLDSIMFSGYGATEFTWKLEESIQSYYFIDQPANDSITVRKSFMADTSITFQLEVKGSHGTCSDSTTFTLPLILSPNDSVKHAIELFLGENPQYSNLCAGIEENEPSPPADKCVDQLSWCDEFGTGEDILANSVWFYFIPDSTAEYEIKTEGIDNQIALYEATSSDELLAGNFTLLAANDDVDAKNFAAKINRVNLEKDKLYFIQADGSAGNITGEFIFFIELLVPESTGPEAENSSWRLYPQPADDKLFLLFPEGHTPAETTLQVYSIAGKQLATETIQTNDGAAASLDIGYLESGLYLLRVVQEGNVSTFRFLKE